MKTKRRTAAEVAEQQTVYDKPIDLQRQNEDTEIWETVRHLHANVNKAAGSSESFGAGADQFHTRLIFKVRYFPVLEQVRNDGGQLWRIVYGGKLYEVVDYDDYMERRRSVRMVGVLYE